MCILQTQSITLFFLYFYYPDKLESGNTYNKQCIHIIIMTCINREKEIQYRKKYQNTNWACKIHRKQVTENNSKKLNNYFAK